MSLSVGQGRIRHGSTAWEQPGLSSPPAFPLLPTFTAPVAKPPCRGHPGLHAPLSGSSLQTSHPLLRAPESDWGHPVGTGPGPCGVRCWISLSSFCQHGEDHDLHRLRVTCLKFGYLASFSILFFLSSPHHSYSGFFSTPLVSSGSPSHAMALGLSSLTPVRDGLGCAEFPSARSKLPRSPSAHQR